MNAAMRTVDVPLTMPIMQISFWRLLFIQNCGFRLPVDVRSFEIHRVIVS